MVFSYLARYHLKVLAPALIAFAFILNGYGQEKAAPDVAAPAPTDSSPATPSAASTETAPNYLLHVNDLIRISVFQEDDMTVETRIPKSGTIMYPLLGAISLENKTVADTQEEIRSLLAKKYIVNPHVTVTVLEYSKLWVTVLGEVQRPGNVEFPPDGGLDLLGTIALASGYTADADAVHVNIRRAVNGHEVILSVNATDLARDPNAKPFMVQPGDAITVPYVKKWVTVLGEVRNPGKVNLPSEGGLDLLGAIALASGYTTDADPDNIDVRRTINGVDSIIQVNGTQLARDSSVKPFIVQPGDTITVKYATAWITVLGEVQRPGKVKIPPEGGLDLLGAVAFAGGFSPEADTAHIAIRRSTNGKDVLLHVNAKELSRNTAVGAFMVQPGDNITVPQRMF